MDTLWIRELTFLYILCFYISLINTTEYVTTIRYSNEYTANISCRNNSQIQIQTIDVQEEETTCRKSTCYVNSIDKHSIQDNCNGENSCLIHFNFTSTCLREFRYMNLSFTCRHENGTAVGTFEEDFGVWTSTPSENFKWKRQNLLRDHTRVSNSTTGYSINVISYSGTAGTAGAARIITDIEYMRPICLSLWYQFQRICTDCFFNIYNTSDGNDSLILSKNGTSTVPKKWHNISVDVNGIGPFKIMLEAVFNNNKSEVTESISVDDTSIAYRPCKGEQIHTTCQDMSKPVRIECEQQFIVGDIKLSLEPEYKADCQDKTIETDLNYVCRNNFNKSEQCYYSVFERRNKSEDCYEFTKNVSVKYLCVDIPDGSLESPVQNDIIGIAAGVSGGVILTIIVVVVICLIKRSKPGQQKASSSNSNKAFDELQNDDKSQQKPTLSLSNRQNIFTPTNSKSNEPRQMDQDDQESDDLYNISNGDGTYDVSNNDKHRGNPNDNNIYSHTADNIYDSGSHHQSQDRNEETYDHFFGQQTEDEYDTTART